MMNKRVWLGLTVACMALSGCVREDTAYSGASPVLGISFRGEAATPHQVMHNRDHSVYEDVGLAFSMRFNNPEKKTLRICAFRKLPQRYLSVEGHKLSDYPCLKSGTGYAGSRTLAQPLTVGEKGHNYLPASRQQFSDGVATVVIDKVHFVDPYPYDANIEMLAVIDRNDDGIFDPGEYEYISLMNPGENYLSETDRHKLVMRDAYNFITFIDKRSSQLISREYHYTSDGISFRGMGLRDYNFERLTKVISSGPIKLKGKVYVGVSYAENDKPLKNTVTWFNYSPKIARAAERTNVALNEALAQANKNSLEAMRELYGREINYFKSPSDARDALLHELVKANNVRRVTLPEEEKMKVWRSKGDALEYDLGKFRFVRVSTYEEIPDSMGEGVPQEDFERFAKAFNHTVAMSFYYSNQKHLRGAPVFIFPLEEKQSAYRVLDALMYLATE